MHLMGCLATLIQNKIKKKSKRKKIIWDYLLIKLT